MEKRAKFRDAGGVGGRAMWNGWKNSSRQFSLVEEQVFRLRGMWVISTQGTYSVKRILREEQKEKEKKNRGGKTVPEVFIFFLCMKIEPGRESYGA